MFEKTLEYPTAFVKDGGDESLLIAMRWIGARLKANGGTPLLYAPRKRNVEYRKPIRDFGARYPVMTPRTRYNVQWRGGPVLAVWLDDKTLGEIADLHGVTAVCAVLWGDKVPAWVAATGAVDLAASGVSSRALPDIDPVVRQGLLSLGHRVNHSNALAGSMDRADAVAFFRALVDARLPIDPDALYAHALFDGWPERGAARLKEMAVKVAAGSRLRGWNEARWRSDIVNVWQEQAAAE